MKNLILLCMLVSLLAVALPANAADYLSGKTQSYPALFKFETAVMNAINRDRCTFLDSIVTDSSVAGTGVVTGTVGVLISNVPYFKAGAVTTAVSGGNVVGSTTLYSCAAYILGMNSSGTFSFTRSAVATGTTKALAQAGIALPALTAGVAPVAAVIVTVDPRAAGAMTWTAGTSLTTTSEVLALVGGYLADPISLNPVNE